MNLKLGRDRNRVLTESEIQRYKRAFQYWKEERESLKSEVFHVSSVFGPRIMKLLEHYIELLDMLDRKEERVENE